MINHIVFYVISNFPYIKSEPYDDNYIKACLVYQNLYVKYFNKSLDMEHIKYILSEWRYSCRSNSPILTNHLIFSLAFREFRKRYKIGRGCVYTFDSPFKKSETLGYLTGIIYWFFHTGVV